MDQKNDAALTMQVLELLEKGQGPRSINTATGIPRLVVDRIRRLHQRAPTLLIRTATGELSITAAYQQLQARQAQPCQSPSPNPKSTVSKPPFRPAHLEAKRS